jgi:hypothetical protein
MTERELDHAMLADLLHRREAAGDPATGDNPILTRRDEQKLLDEANHVKPPTLAPHDISPDLLHLGGKQRTISAASFGAEAIEIIRRNPIPALLLAAGLAYLLTRRHKP